MRRVRRLLALVFLIPLGGCQAGGGYANQQMSQLSITGDACAGLIVTPIAVGYYAIKGFFEFISGPAPWDTEGSTQ